MSNVEFPKIVQVELTNICNASCVICPVFSMKRKRSIMEMSLWQRILSELQDEKFRGRLMPFLSGDSLLIPNILDYLKLARKMLPDSVIRIATNGSKLEGEVARAIVEEGLIDDLCISFDGGTKESYEAIRHGLSFERVTKNVKEFIRIRDALLVKKPIVKIEMLVTKDNANTIGSLKTLFSNADIIEIHSTHNWGGQHGSQIINTKNPLRTANFCPGLCVMTILVDGSVSLCCLDYEGTTSLGNLTQSSIKECWTGSTRKAIMTALSNREFDKLPLCQHCSGLDHNILAQMIMRAESHFGSGPATNGLLHTVLRKADYLYNRLRIFSRAR